MDSSAAPAIDWYRTPLPPEAFRELHRRSDFLGFLQTGGYLGLLALFFAGAVWSGSHASAWVTVSFILLYGVVASFFINAVHELSHGTVFRTKALNAFFVHVCAFLGWANHETFRDSHARHHRYTLHPPDDLEVVLPIRLLVRHFVLTAVVDPKVAYYALRNAWRIARSRFEGEWERTLYPEDAPEARRAAVRWARCLVAGHLAVAVAGIASGQFVASFLLSFGSFVGNGLYFLCNNTQHVGLRDNVADFRLCCRTFTLHPAIRFLYWQMNYHTEHHMYAAVPCYRLHRLHRLIRHDLPPCPEGLAAVWREIATIQARQEADPGYRHPIPLPSSKPSGAFVPSVS